MRLTVTTWNINSVRLRIDLVAKFLKAVRPDVLCLQETKCPDDALSAQAIQAARLRACRAQRPEGLSRRRRGLAAAVRDAIDIRSFCGKTDCRHIAGRRSANAPDLREPITLHNFYVPAGGDDSGSRAQSEIRPQARLPRRDGRRANRCIRRRRRARILVGDLNVAPLEHDVWSHKQLLRVVSHTPIECEKLNAARRCRRLGRRHARARCRSRTKLYTWWSYRAADWTGRRPRPPARSHLDVRRARRPRVEHRDRQGSIAAPSRPSDHVPVTATIEM